MAHSGGSTRPFQAAIQKLVQLLVRVRTGEVSREAAPALIHELQAELLRLGVTEARLPAVMHDVEEAAEVIASVRIAEREPGVLRDVPRISPPSKRTEMTEIVREAEDRVGVRLTAPARNLIRIPAVELYELTEDWNRDQVEKSVAMILETVSDTQATQVEDRIGRRISTSVLAALHKRWCNIPPFCARVKRVER